MSAAIESSKAKEPVSDATQFFRLPDVLARYRISRSHWYQLIAAGHAPKPTKLGLRCTAWRREALEAFERSQEAMR